MLVSGFEMLLVTSLVFMYAFVINAVTTFHELRKIHGKQESISISLKIAWSVPILIYLLNQASSISMIFYYYENNNLQFCTVSLILFIIYRATISLNMAIWSNKGKNIMYCLFYFIWDYNLYRSLLLDFICKTNIHQQILIGVQILIISVFQFIFCLISLLSTDNNPFIVYYGLTISSIAILFQSTNPAQPYTEFPTLFCYILDIFAQLFIFTLLFLSAGSIVFYICILLKPVIMFLVATFTENDLGYNANYPYIVSLYQTGYYDVTSSGIKYLFIISSVSNIIYCIIVTIFIHIAVFINTKDNNSHLIYHEMLILLIVSWIIIICVPIFLWLQDKEGWTFNPFNILDTSYLKLHRYPDYDCWDWEEKFYCSIGTVHGLCQDFKIHHEIKPVEPRWKWGKKAVLMDNGNDSKVSCTIYKQILMEYDEYKNEMDETQRVECVYGYVHEWEQDIKYMLIPNEIIGCILYYFGLNDDICFCCYGNKIAQTSRQWTNHTIISDLIHIHQNGMMIPKLLGLFTDCKVITYCISVYPLDYEMINESLNQYESMVNNELLNKVAFIVFFTELIEFKQMDLTNVISICKSFGDYDSQFLGQDPSTNEELFEFISGKFIECDRREHTMTKIMKFEHPNSSNKRKLVHSMFSGR